MTGDPSRAQVHVQARDARVHEKRCAAAAERQRRYRERLRSGRRLVTLEIDEGLLWDLQGAGLLPEDLNDDDGDAIALQLADLLRRLAGDA